MEQPIINPTQPVPDMAPIPIETPPAAEIIPAPAPTPESIVPASAEATAGKPVEPTPAPVAVPAPTPVPIAPPVEPKPEVLATASEPTSAVRSLLAKAKETIQFRKRAKLEKIMVKAREQGSITNDQAQKLLRVSDATASRYLSELTKAGRLRASGRTSGTRYTPVQ